jgi:hypothetical protein
MVVLTGAVSLSGRVEAQQTGLFPLAPIRRQRVPCDQEDPNFKIYKQQYFGYHPQCWRPFPAGWGCPSSEAPNREQSFRDLPPGNMPDEEAAELGPDDRGAPPVRRTPEIPNLPRERDPFTPDDPAGGMPNANPLPRNNPPRTAPPRADDPFRDLNNPGASLAPSRSRSLPRSAPAIPDESAPELAAPAASPARGSASLRSARGGADSDDPGTDDQGPALGLSDSDIERSDAASALDAQPEVPAAGSPSEVLAAAAAPSAQPRRRIFGNLFSGIGSNWLRR